MTDVVRAVKQPQISNCRFATPPHPTSLALSHLLLREKALQLPEIKGKRGECSFAPLIAPVSHRAISCNLSANLSGRQHFAALCTAASQNLTAVGSSHSLTETVDLGTVTTAGLIGTFHEVTPPVKSQLCSTVPGTAATHSRRP